MGRPIGSQNKDKPFRAALRLAITDAGEDHRALRDVAAKLLEMAQAGDIQAIKELADRVDGKVPQAIVGDDEHPPVIEAISDRDRARALAALVNKAKAGADSGGEDSA